MKIKGPIKENSKAKQLQLQREWEAILAKHSRPLERGAKSKGVKTYKLSNNVKKPSEVIRYVELPKSLGTTDGVATKSAPKVYTGTKIVGIATMHKSNMVPIFNAEDAVDVAKMRRG